MASKEANKAKYQYNKKYMESYWERRAQRENGNTPPTTIQGEMKKETTILSIFEQDFPIQKPTDEDVTVNRNGKSDEKYIVALEIANKRLNSENKRLIRMLRKQHGIIRQSITGLYYES